MEKAHVPVAKAGGLLTLHSCVPQNIIIFSLEYPYFA
jgi:hypothetical protein